IPPRLALENMLPPIRCHDDQPPVDSFVGPGFVVRGIGELFRGGRPAVVELAEMELFVGGRFVGGHEVGCSRGRSEGSKTEIAPPSTPSDQDNRIAPKLRGWSRLLRRPRSVTRDWLGSVQSPRSL